MAGRKLVLTEEELIEKYNLSEDEQVYLLPIMVEIENAVRRHFIRPQ
ncbi:MAG: hypothetical protein GX893_06380 [Firmicutes bacterium]|nr:hypothetical protein [Bacillota bacterium]